MKIDDSKQQMAMMQQMSGREKPEQAAAAQSETAAKPQPAADKVQLSGMTPMMSSADMQMQQAQRSQRVQEIKAQVQAGTYKVDPRAVAEKMLSRFAGGTSVDTVH